MVIAQINERDEKSQALIVQITEQHEFIQTLSSRLNEHSEKIQTLTTQLSRQTEKEEAFHAQIIDRDERVREVNTKLNEIYISKAWKLAIFFRKTKAAIIHPGNFFDKGSKIVIRSYWIIRKEGLKIFINRGMQKALPKHHFFTSDLVDTDIIEPRATIIIPVFNALHHTKNCIQKLYSTPNETNFEVLVIDNCSTDDTPLYLAEEIQKHEKFRYYRMEKNLGFAGAVNFGFLQALGNIFGNIKQ